MLALQIQSSNRLGDALIRHLTPPRGGSKTLIGDRDLTQICANFNHLSYPMYPTRRNRTVSEDVLILGRIMYERHIKPTIFCKNCEDPKTGSSVRLRYRRFQEDTSESKLDKFAAGILDFSKAELKRQAMWVSLGRIMVE